MYTKKIHKRYIISENCGRLKNKFTLLCHHLVCRLRALLIILISSGPSLVGQKLHHLLVKKVASNLFFNKYSCIILVNKYIQIIVLTSFFILYYVQSLDKPLFCVFTYRPHLPVCLLPYLKSLFNFMRCILCNRRPLFSLVWAYFLSLIRPDDVAIPNEMSDF